MSSLIVEVVKIDNVLTHPNADKLEIAVVKGWNCIIQKGSYKVGDEVVFIPPDSVLPQSLIEKYEITYLKNSSGRIGTVKLRGALSEGLILPKPTGSFVGENVAQKMGITKWEAPEPVSVGMKANPTSKRKLNPYFDRYTDIENVKNFNDVFKNGEMVVITEKIHGSNFRAGRLPIDINSNQPFFEKLKSFFRKYILKQTHEYVLGSHNVQLHSENKGKTYYSENIWEKVAEKYDFKSWLPEDTIVYGEVYGKSVQDLTYGLEDVDLVVFDVKQNGRYLNWYEMNDFCKEYGLPVVPMLFVGTFDQEILQFCTNGKSTICPTQIREGCVVKPLEENKHHMIGRKILKSISPDYLTRKNGTEYH